MSIDLKEFEHIFRAGVLKNGLRICKNGWVSLLEKKTNNNFEFLVFDKHNFEINIIKKAQKITDYNCACNKTKNFCEHLCAVVFYLEKESLGIDIKVSKKVVKKASVTKIKKNKEINFKEFLYNVEYTQLLDFIEKEGLKNELLKQQIINRFTLKTNESAFKNYCNDLKIILWNYLEYGKISQKQSNDIFKKITELELQAKTQNASCNHLFFYSLALICELPKLFKIKTNASDSELYTLIHQAINYLNTYFNSELTFLEIRALQDATPQILKNNSYLSVELTSSIIKKTIAFIDDINELQKLKTIVAKLKDKHFYYFTVINELEIIKQQLTLKYFELTNTLPLNIDTNFIIEYTLAKAELLINKGKSKVGLLELDTLYAELKQKNNSKFLSYISYLLKIAIYYNIKPLQIKCLSDSIIYNYDINFEHLEALKKIIGNANFNTTIDALISAIKLNKTKNASLKVISLLNYTNRMSDIILELKNKNQLFTELNTVVLKNLPSYSFELIDMYCTHFIYAINEARYDFYKETVFKQAQRYINGLPANAQTYLIQKILESIPKTKFIYNLIKKNYPLV